MIDADLFWFCNCPGRYKVSLTMGGLGSTGSETNALGEACAQGIEDHFDPYARMSAPENEAQVMPVLTPTRDFKAPRQSDLKLRNENP
jgi:hypothetical protein